VSELQEGQTVEVTYTGRLVRLAPRERPRIALVSVAGDTPPKYVPLNDHRFAIRPEEEGMRAAILAYLRAVDNGDPDYPTIPDVEGLRAAVRDG
jgi:hypothetical protein